MARRVIVWTLILVLNINQSLLAQSTSRVADHEQALAQLDRFMELVQELRSHVDRSQFDTDALLDKLAYDEEQILAFVRSEIHFEQYPGSLRGIQGTLASRAGNALDQSTLLAHLLKQAGLDARIVRGTLSEGDARLLLLGMIAERAPPLAVGDTAAMRQAVSEFCDELALDCVEVEALFDGGQSASPTPEQRQLLTRYRDATEQLVDALEQAGITPEQDAQLVALTEEAKDYFWVEYRLGPADPWTAAHPAFGGGEEDPVPQTTATYAEQVPEQLLHKVGFEVVLQQRQGAREVTHVLVPKWERPAANLDSLPLTFHIASGNFMTAAGDLSREFDPDEIYSDLFIPSFSGGPATLAFDFAGNAVPLEAAASTYAGVFQETADNFNQAAGALGALGGSSSSDGSSRVTATNAIIARFTTTAPDGQQREYQRTIYDARFPVLTPAGLSDPARLNEQAYRAITRMFTFQVHAGSPSPARLLDAQLEAYLQRRPSLEGIVNYHYEGAQALERTAVTDAGDQVSWMGHRMLATLFDALPEREPAHSNYRDRPNIAVHYRTLPIGETIQEGIDIVQNSRRAFADVGGELVADSAALIRSGVWETATEGSLLMPGSGPDINAVEVFAQARGDGLQAHVLNTVDDAADLMYSEISLEAIERDLAMGYTVVLPSYEPSVNTPVAWWRVNPETGETLGMGFNGEGAETEEYAQKLMLIGLGAAWAVQIYVICLTGTSLAGNADSNTCSSVAISTSALGLSILTGNVVGAAMATAALMNIVRIKVTSQ